MYLVLPAKLLLDARRDDGKTPNIQSCVSSHTSGEDHSDFSRLWDLKVHILSHTDIHLRGKAGIPNAAISELLRKSLATVVGELAIVSLFRHQQQYTTLSGFCHELCTPNGANVLQKPTRNPARVAAGKNLNVQPL